MERLSHGSIRRPLHRPVLTLGQSLPESQSQSLVAHSSGQFPVGTPDSSPSRSSLSRHTPSTLSSPASSVSPTTPRTPMLPRVLERDCPPAPGGGRWECLSDSDDEASTARMTSLLRRHQTPPLGHMGARVRNPSPIPGFVPRAPTPVPASILVSSLDLLDALLRECADTLDVGELRDKCGELRMERDALQKLNAQVETYLEGLLTDPAQSREAVVPELLQLLGELEERASRIRDIEVELAHVERMLQDHPEPEQAAGLAHGDEEMEEEPPNACHYCVSRSADTVYRCCQYRGACSQCAMVMLQNTAACPHCRAPHPSIDGLLPTRTIPLFND